MPPEALKFLEDARLAIVRVMDFTSGRTASEYESSVLLRSAVERQFEIIGEALNRASKIDEDLVSRITDYRQIIAFRNILIHGYAVVDHSIVWSIIQDKLELLHREVCELLEDHG